ncbi:MAG TPA: GIY-YIG nuclease family protein [Pseudoxanthomonas sp.]|nr:GIY-YIG nuclease family protein [Pseudoxanthomonas sp.]
MVHRRNSGQAKESLQVEGTDSLCLHSGQQTTRHPLLYIGVTSDLPGRIWQHKHDQVDGFTRRYGIHTLVWYEVHARMESAILREKALKAWKRVWKIRLVEDANPTWRDLYPTSFDTIEAQRR